MMPGPPTARRVPLAHFGRAREGVAIVEFALFVPVLLGLVLATAELVNAVDHKRKVVQLSRALADLTAQGDVQNPISASLMSDIVAAAQPVLAPFSAATATIQISAVGVYLTNGKVASYICSTYPATGGTRSVGLATDVVVPTNFQRAGARFVLSEVRMPYRPILGSVVPRVVKGLNLSLTWSETVTWPVRTGVAYTSATDPEVVLPKGAACP